MRGSDPPGPDVMRAACRQNRKIMGLLALMLLHDSRRNARVRGRELVTLEDQDRSLWDRGRDCGRTRAGRESGLNLGGRGPIRLQAAIAALHARGRSGSSETDWRQIAALYERLMDMNPSPVIALNHAAAVAMSGRIEEGLKRIDDLSGSLDQYYLFHAARADLLRRLNRHAGAAAAYQRALGLATNQLEIDFLSRRLRQVEAPQP